MSVNGAVNRISESLNNSPLASGVREARTGFDHGRPDQSVRIHGSLPPRPSAPKPRPSKEMWVARFLLLPPCRDNVLDLERSGNVCQSCYVGEFKPEQFFSEPAPLDDGISMHEQLISGRSGVEVVPHER